MKLLKNKSGKGKLSTGMLNDAILAIVLIIVLFLLYAELVPEAQTAGDTLNATGVPLGNLFTSGGVIFVVIMAALLIVVITAVLAMGK